MKNAFSAARRTISAALAGAALAAALAAGGSAEAATLKPRVTVSGPFVTLGDLVDGAGEAAATPVFRSPDPGTAGEVDARTVADLARRNGLEVQSLGLDAIVVARSSRVVTAEEIRAHVVRELAAMAGTDPDRIAVRFDEPLADIHVEEENAAPLALASTHLRREAGRFGAVLTLPGSRVFAAGRQVSGALSVMTPVVTLGRRVERGQTIGAGDLRIALIPVNQLRADSFGDIAAVAGKAARRSLPEGAVPASSDLAEPVLVSRNSAVTIVHRRGALTLTARGRALSDGARGDVIRVLNDYTRRIVETEVVAAGAVELLSAPANFAALAAN